MRQFNPSDTISWSPRWGASGDGSKTVSSNESYDGANAGLSGAHTANPLVQNPTITLDSASGFANGDIILIHQSRGTNAGVWELNKIKTGGGSTSLELEYPLINNYLDDGGNSQAQVFELKQFSALTIDATFTYSAVQWNGNTGGIIAFFVNGTMTVNGTLSASALGFRGGTGTNNNTAVQGEGASGPGTNVSPSSNNANDTGGGGGQDPVGSGWGGNATHTVANLTSRLLFGGAGGGCAGQGYTGGTGGNGGGIVLFFANTLTVNNTTGLITANGGNGTNTLGGAGAGGAILIKTSAGTLNTTRVTANGGTRGTFASNDDAGGSGGGVVAGTHGHAHNTGPDGAIHIDYYTLSGTTSPTYNSLQSELYSNFYAHEAIFDAHKASLMQEKFKRQIDVVSI